MKKIRYSVKMNALFAILVVLVIACTFFFNAIMLVLANRYPLALDLTANAAYGISDETKGLLAGLSQDIGVYVLSGKASFEGNSYLIQTRNILDLYPKYSARIDLRYIDFVSEPAFASGYPQLSLAEGDILVTCGEKIRQIKLANMFNYSYSGSTSSNLAIESSRAEEALTSAILFVTTGKQVRLAVLKGNGVLDMPVFTALLTDNNYQLEEVNLTMGTLDDFDGCILIAPAADLSDDILGKLEAFLYNGGSYGRTMLYCADVSQPALPNLETFLSEWGVTIDDGAVFETTAGRAYNYQPYYPTVSYVNTDYADKLRDKATPFLMPQSRPLSLLFAVRDSRYTETLLSFYETAGVRPSAADNTFKASQAARRGPLPAMILASRRILGTTGFTKYRSNMIISASAHMLSSTALQNSSVSNSEYLMNLFADLFEREASVNIAPRSLSAQVLGVTTSQASFLAIVLCGILPGLILLTGIGIWLFRRYK